MTEAPGSRGDAGDVVIGVRGLRKVFGTQTVLDGVNLDICRGETLVVMGGSGCGKSTFLRLLIGAIPATSGSISVFDRELDTSDEEQLNAYRNRFGILFQSGALFNSMTIAERGAAS